MATPHIDGDTLVVTLTRQEKLLALRGDLRVPVSGVQEIEVVDDPLHAVRGLRSPGLGLPGRTKVGTWRRPGARSFVVVHGDRRGIRIGLRDVGFDSIVLGTDRPEELAASLRAGIR